MNSVDRLARLLQPEEPAADPAPVATRDLDALIERLQRKVSAGSECREPLDLQHETVRRFWRDGRIDSLRDARLLAFGLGLPAGPEGARVLDDGTRMDALLRAADGWAGNPRWFRRCFQGLVWSYFNQERADEATPAHANWLKLRDYLQRRAQATLEPGAPAPDWVAALATHRALFTETPCADFIAPLLKGDRTALDAVRERLGIGESSWFVRALIEAQVLAATRGSHEAFATWLPAMLDLLEGGRAWRDTGLMLLLRRHAQIPQAPLDARLRDAVAVAWGCPWKPVDAWRWEGVGEEARKLAGDALKASLIDGFFDRTDASAPDRTETRLDAAASGPSTFPVGQGARRAAFWKRYLPSIRALEFACTASAPLPPTTRGLVVELRAAAGAATFEGVESGQGGRARAAMVLTMGCAQIVVFDDPHDPMLAYDLRRRVPFDAGQPLALAPEASNSLCRSDRDLALRHRDGVDGWRQWEQLFETALKDQFDLRVGAARTADRSAFVDLSDPGAGLVEPRTPATADRPRIPSTRNGEDVHWQTAEAMSVPYSRGDLEVLARVHDLRLVDEGGASSRVRVCGDAIDRRIGLVLRRWGFEAVSATEWRR